jgi:uncharacterized protein
MDESPLEFPGHHPVTVMGRDTPEFRAHTYAVVLAQVGPLEPALIAERSSRDGTYLSITYTVPAESREQLDALYRALHATGLVLFAL